MAAEQTVFHRIYGAACNALNDENSSTQSAYIIAHELSNVEDSTNPFRSFCNGEKTLFELAEEKRTAALGGIKRYLPQNYDRIHNDDINALSQIVPNVEHYKKSHVFRLDNPLSGTLYGFAAGIPLKNEFDLNLEICTLAGALVGSLAMLILRNRSIPGHERESYEHARVWDTTQFLDAIAYIGNNEGLEGLENLNK